MLTLKKILWIRTKGEEGKENQLGAQNWIKHRGSRWAQAVRAMRTLA